MDQAAIKGLQTLLDETAQDSKLAWWDWDIAANKVTSNARKVTMLGYEPADFADAGFEAFTALLHPDDHEPAMEAMRAHLSGRAAIYQVDYRIRKVDGDYTWFMDRGLTTERDAAGKPRRLRGLVIDLGTSFERSARDEAVLRLARQALPRSGGQREHVTLCSTCQRLKLSETDWMHVGQQLPAAFPRQISHGLCPDCLVAMYPEDAEEIMAEIRARQQA